MKHIEEHILELYILRDKDVLRKKASIERHLRECAGCRELADKMQALYADVEQELQSKQMSKKIESTLPARIQETTSEIWHRPNLPVASNWSYVQKWTPVALQRFWFIVGNFVYQKPITSTVGSIVFLGLLIFAFNTISKTTITDKNPKFYRYTNNDFFEVYNGRNELLWSAIGENLAQINASEKVRGNQKTIIEDINGDGINEVITSLPLGHENKYSREIIVYDNLGNVVKKIAFNDRNFSFRDLNYDRLFTQGNIFKYRNSQNKLRIITLANSGRSPVFVAQFDSNFNVVGKYWHFGHVNPTFINLEGKNVLLLMGKNDVYDYSMADFPTLGILDPEKIIGDKECTATIGFGHTKSDAELYYIRFPVTDMEKALNLIAITRHLAYEDSSIIHINVGSGYPSNDERFVSFDYVFDKMTMSVVNLKFNTGTERTHKRLKEEGKITSTFNEKYLEEIKRSVLYWDGKGWQKNPTKIEHNSNITSK